MQRCVGRTGNVSADLVQTAERMLRLGWETPETMHFTVGV